MPPMLQLVPQSTPGATPPACEIGARAFSLIVEAIGVVPHPARDFLSYGTGAVDALLKLEAVFGIAIEVDEVAGLRTPGVVELVRDRVANPPPELVWDPDLGVYLLRDGEDWVRFTPHRSVGDGEPAIVAKAPRPAPRRWRGRRRTVGPLFTPFGWYVVGVCAVLALGVGWLVKTHGGH